MNILESEIEDLIWDAIQSNQHDILQERGLPISEGYKYERQFDLGSYGRADLIGFKPRSPYYIQGQKCRVIDVQIFELKKDKVTADTFFQALRYAKGIEHKAKHENLPYSFEFSFYLVGKEFETTHTSFPYLPDFFTDLNVYTFSFSITDGLIFTERSGYKLTKPSFKEGSGDLITVFMEQVKQQRDLLDLDRYFDERKKLSAADGTKETEDLPF